ncbi:ScbR family autoregulator-binding transcription factor [Streptomyces sp. NPDC086549]|uniref:ScbR family autoregulator-binding transcription factor n=1 Tax=Streptomyces sp. NPDC086549 TaxID=3365752 RepID=UPI00380EB918
MVKQVRAARTRHALILAAAEVFAADGYAMASLPSISKRAGVSAGALHFHFASKDALAREVETAAADSVEKMAERCRSAADSSLQSLVHTTCSLLLAVTSDPVIRAGLKLSVDPSRKNGAGLVQWWSEWVHDLVVRAQASGELADDLSPEGAAAAIVAATVGFEILGSRDGEWLSGERMVQFWTFLLPRLAAASQLESALAAAETAAATAPGKTVY